LSLLWPQIETDGIFSTRALRAVENTLMLLTAYLIVGKGPPETIVPLIQQVKVVMRKNGGLQANH